MMSVRKLDGRAASAIRGVYRSPVPLATTRKEGILAGHGDPSRRVEPAALAGGGGAPRLWSPHRLDRPPRWRRPAGDANQLGADPGMEGARGWSPIRGLWARRRRGRHSSSCSGPARGKRHASPRWRGLRRSSLEQASWSSTLRWKAATMGSKRAGSPSRDARAIATASRVDRCTEPGSRRSSP